MNNKTKGNKRILVLGAADLQLPLIKRIKERGYELVVASPVPTEPGFAYADYSIIADVKDEETILKESKRLQIDGAVTDQTDLAVRTVAYVTEKMGLSTIGYETSCLFTDKVLMREKCQELNLNPIPYLLTFELESAISFFKQLNSKAIIKPADSQASKGVHKIDTVEDLREHFADAQQYSRNGKVLVEKFIEGRELLVDSVVVNGEVKPLTIGEYTPFAVKDVFSSYETIFPSKISDEAKQKIWNFNEKIIKGFGLNNSRTHAEYLFDGKDTYLVEIAARGGGVFISTDAVKLCSGICSEDFLIDNALGIHEMPKPTSDFVPRYYANMFFYLPEGEILSIDGLDDILSLPFVHHWLIGGLEVGATTPPLTDKNERKEFTIDAANYEELSQRIQQIRSMLDIRVKTPNGVKGIIWK